MATAVRVRLILPLIAQLAAIIDHMTSRRSFILGACGAVALSAKNDPADLTLAAASERVRKKAISPVELAKACLQRVEQLNPRLNAYITVTAEAALAHARDLEAEIQRGRWRGPLHGIQAEAVSVPKRLPRRASFGVGSARVLSRVVSPCLKHRLLAGHPPASVAM